MAAVSSGCLSDTQGGHQHRHGGPQKQKRHCKKKMQFYDGLRPQPTTKAV